MLELQGLSRGHEAAVLAFEKLNRAYFAESINDRGDEFFDEFAEWYRPSLAAQEAGVCRFHVLVEEDGTVVGRFNLYDLVDGTADVGYRVARNVAGRGVDHGVERPVPDGRRRVRAAAAQSGNQDRECGL